MDYSIRLGGEAGQGIQTVGYTLSKVFSRAGYHVFTHQDYESRVRGGHNFFQMRLSDKPVTGPREVIDILVAFDHESIARYEGQLTDYGQVIYDSRSLKKSYDKSQFLDIPFEALAMEQGGSRIMANTVATGAIMGMLGMELDILLGLLREAFHRKGEEVVTANLNAAMAGHDYAVRECVRCSFALAPAAKPRMLISGVDAIAMGAIASGCKFYSAYPMTPSTGIMDYVADKAKEFGIVVEQAEDEIAAVNMALGASFAGVRAMTGSSGGGFALMVEGVSLAAMTETPLVIALGQRPGPATGFPTRTEQAELLFTLHSGHGEFPRVVFAPGNPEQAFFLTHKAFDIAEKYQIPVFIMFDQYLADTQWTLEGIDLKELRYTDYRLRAGALSTLKSYRRHLLTENGVSPLGVPGESRHLVVTDSDEHDEEGHMVEDAETRIKMVDKRLFKKLPLIAQEIAPPLLYGSAEPDVIIVGWGSTYGVLKESVDAMMKEKKIALLHFSEIYPFPRNEEPGYLDMLKNAKLTICVENNATGQFARLMRAEKGYEFHARINKYDGRPFTLEGLIGELNAHMGRL
jgi:2-oxoglutarate ferredoxin oxidoreductase subunit alpha